MGEKIILRHWAWKEGQAAALNGYCGANPYLSEHYKTAAQWRDGYLAALKERLDNGLRAIDAKEVN